MNRREFLRSLSSGALGCLVIDPNDNNDGLQCFSPRKLAELFNLLPSQPVTEPVIRSGNLRDNFLWRGNQNCQMAALTFDDGWWKPAIEGLIEFAEQNKFRGTAFPAGQAIDAYPPLWKKLADLGFEFGCHTYSHRFDLHTLPAEVTIQEIERSQLSLDKALGYHYPFRFFRPVGGTMSWSIVEALQKTNLTGVIWSLSSEGTSKIATAATVANRIVNLTGNGYITLQHFINCDVAAMGDIFSGLMKKGITPVPISEAV